jgi:hypothetical protein
LNFAHKQAEKLFAFSEPFYDSKLIGDVADSDGENHEEGNETQRYQKHANRGPERSMLGQEDSNREKGNENAQSDLTEMPSAHTPKSAPGLNSMLGHERGASVCW